MNNDDLFLMAMAHGYEYNHNDYDYEDIKYHSREHVRNALIRCYSNLEEYLSGIIDEDELNIRLNNNVRYLTADEIAYVSKDLNRTVRENGRNR